MPTTTSCSPRCSCSSLTALPPHHTLCLWSLHTPLTHLSTQATPAWPRLCLHSGRAPLRSTSQPHLNMPLHFAEGYLSLNIPSPVVHRSHTPHGAGPTILGGRVAHTCDLSHSSREHSLSCLGYATRCWENTLLGHCTLEGSPLWNICSLELCSHACLSDSGTHPRRLHHTPATHSTWYTRWCLYLVAGHHRYMASGGHHSTVTSPVRPDLPALHIFRWPGGRSHTLSPGARQPVPHTASCVWDVSLTHTSTDCPITPATYRRRSLSNHVPHGASARSRRVHSGWALPATRRAPPRGLRALWPLTSWYISHTYLHLSHGGICLHFLLPLWTCLIYHVVEDLPSLTPTQPSNTPTGCGHILHVFLTHLASTHAMT